MVHDTSETARSWLVEHHQLRVAGERHPHVELALLAVGERADERSLAPAESDTLCKRAGTGEHLFVPLGAEDAVVPVAHAED